MRAPLTFQTKAALLFADVSGFASRTKTLQDLRGDIRGAEDLNRILSDYFDIMIKSFELHGGDVVAFSGDAMTVVFPGDDLTLCAPVRCALHILEATKGYSLAAEGLENELTLHAGAGAGEVQVVQVTCENRGGLQKTTGGKDVYERCTCVMMGEPLIQLKYAEDLANSGEAVVGRAHWRSNAPRRPRRPTARPSRRRPRRRSLQKRNKNLLRCSRSSRRCWGSPPRTTATRAA